MEIDPSIGIDPNDSVTHAILFPSIDRDPVRAVSPERSMKPTFPVEPIVHKISPPFTMLAPQNAYILMVPSGSIAT